MLCGAQIVIRSLVFAKEYQHSTEIRCPHIFYCDDLWHLMPSEIRDIENIMILHFR